MNTAELLPYFALVTTLGSGLFAFVQWMDQRQRELRSRRFDQYWKLVDVCTETTIIAKQKVAILQLKSFPEYREETVAFLEDAKGRSGGWTEQNIVQIENVIAFFSQN